MLSKGFVEATLSTYLGRSSSYGVHLFLVNGKSSMFSYLTLSDILEFFDILSPDSYPSIYVVPSSDSCIIDLYSDRILVFSCSGDFLYEYRDNVRCNNAK